MRPQEIVQIRKLLAMTQEQFSRLFDVHPMTVSKWERGESQPSPYQVGLLESFGQAAQRDSAAVQEEVKKLMITAGVIAALAFLLTRK
jgi:putative transcriptional regulator